MNILYAALAGAGGGILVGVILYFVFKSIFGSVKAKKNSDRAADVVQADQVKLNTEAIKSIARQIGAEYKEEIKALDKYEIDEDKIDDFKKSVLARDSNYLSKADKKVSKTKIR